MADRLAALEVRSKLVPMTTSGDRGAPLTSSPAGLKGLWVTDIVDALQHGEIDLAVHSAKDLPSEDDEGVVVAAVPERAVPFDLLVSRDPGVPAGGAVGSSSLRRRGQLAAARPDLRVVEIRGNVDTRLRKLAEGEVEGLVLAAAGLARLGVEAEHGEVLGADVMVPAPGQGALAVQARTEGPARDAVRAIEDGPSRLAFEAERALVRFVGGGCALPLGALATVEGSEIRLTAVVLRQDGTGAVRAEAGGDAPEAVAREVADRLLAGGAAAILEEVR